MKRPDKVFLEYIQSNYQNQLKSADNQRQSKLSIDYTLLNDYFVEQTGRDFFDYDNYKKIIRNVETEINDGRSNKNWINLLIVDVPPNIELHDLDANYNGDIISAKAMIKNITPIQVSLKTAVYECRGCFRLLRVDVTDNQMITLPSICPDCAGKSFRLNQDMSEYRNYRYVKLEEPLEYRSGGNSRDFKAYMQDYLASPQHNLKAGDVCDIIGEFKVEKSDKNSKKDDDFEFVIDLHNISPVNDAFEDYRITEEDKHEIIELSKSKNIYDRLVRSLAPEIVGYDTVKEGLLLQLFEGYRPREDVFKADLMDRWTIHILLIGDPGIGKSQIISALNKRCPKIISIAGTSTSQAGLTTSAVKDELTGSWAMEAGAVVLADTGLLCIDEYDKLSGQSQKSLNEPMEQLSVSSAKAGLVQTMSARTSVLACANPKYSRFNPYKSLKEQINIPDSNLSRFDLVFALNDTIDCDKDARLASSLLNKAEIMEKKTDLIESELFKKYITYAKLECFPTLDKNAKNELINFYVSTRQAASSGDSAKPITARDLKAIERLTIARAKTELRDKANVDDARCAIRIYSKALESIGLTPETAGELENIKSEKEIQAIADTEKLIRAKMKQYNLRSVDEVIMADIKYEVGLMCYTLKLDVEEILSLAIENVKKSL